MSAKSAPAIAPTVVVMTTEAPPMLVPAAIDATVPDAKRGAKRQRKDATEAVATGATAATSATPAAPVQKKAKGKAKAEGNNAPVEEAVNPAPNEDVEKTGEPGTWLIVAKTVRGLLKSNPNAAMHCGSDALPALNARVVEIIQEAITRAVANNRKTLKSCDF